MKFFRYLRYLIRHKWYVMMECFRIGLYWRGCFHDLSKFLPSEFIPYMNFFYGKPGSSIASPRDSTGYYKPYDTGDPDFDFAWLLHQKRNDHHWQWWVLPMDEGGFKVHEMSHDARREMLCDWKGAGRAQGKLDEEGQPEVLGWYRAHRQHMLLGESTRILVEEELGFRDVKGGS